MAKIYEFNNNQDNTNETPEVCDCPQCEIIDDYTALLLEAEDADELREFLSWAVEDAVKLGIKRALIADVEHKMSILNDMEECCCEDEC